MGNDDLDLPDRMQMNKEVCFGSLELSFPAEIDSTLGSY